MGPTLSRDLPVLRTRGTSGNSFSSPSPQINKAEMEINKIVIIGCTHGDEIIGKKVINFFDSVKLEWGSITGVIANKKALARKKRFIDIDLNRSFPGKQFGNNEEVIAYNLKNKLKKYDLCLDIHATNSHFNNAIIITKLNKRIKQLLKLIPVKKVVLMKKKIMKSGALIHHTPLGICLEYGPNKSGANYKYAIQDIYQLLTNLDFLKGKKKFYIKKELYEVDDIYKVHKNFVPNKILKDFSLIKKGQFIGKLNDEKKFSRKNFYPIFLGKGRYESTLALMANKKEWTFDK